MSLNVGIGDLALFLKEPDLEEIAPAVGIRLQEGRLSADAAIELGDHRIQRQHPFGTERLVWPILFEAAWQSVELRSAIRLG